MIRASLAAVLLCLVTSARAQNGPRPFGYPLAPLPAGDLWWCESTYKVLPDSRAPVRPKNVRPQPPISLLAAQREREHVQLIFRPNRDPGPIQVVATALTKAGARIPASAVQVRQVDYVRVTQPTDRLGSAGEWPDPLPPLGVAWRPRPGRNNPLWITVSVPPDTPAGNYTGRIVLQTRSWRREVPIKLHVWAFTLPVNRTLRSGFGISPENIRRYHNLKTDASLKRVWDLYMKVFDRSRLAPIDPAAIAPIRVSLAGANWIGGKRDTFEKSVGEASLKIVDDRTDRAVEARFTALIPFSQTDGYRLAWRCKTAEPGQPHMLTVEPYDAGRNWLRGGNVDIVRVGSGAWQVGQEAVARRLPPETAFVRIVLRPVVWTEKGERTGTAWFDEVGFTRVSDQVNLLEDGGFESISNLKVAMDFTEFDRAGKQYLDPPGFSAFRVPFEGLGGGHHPNHTPGTFLGYEAGTEEYEALMAQYGRQLRNHLERMGWLDRAYVYWYDEPEEADYPFVRQGMEQVKRYAPKIKRLLTEEVQPTLAGRVDIWCPMTPNFQSPAAAERQRQGEEVWWYICAEPKEPYAGLFIDHPAIDLRMWLWQTWKYRVQGVVVWETTWWTSPAQLKQGVQNPWDDPMSYTDQPTGTWGNGDGRLFYPPNRRANDDRDTEYLTGPVVSQRWEILSDGVEDWEYFHLLDQLVRKAETNGDHSPAVERAKKLLTVPEAICRDMTHFSRDPLLLLSYRTRLAQALEGMTARVR